MAQELYDAIARLLTEQRNPASMNMDMMSTEEILRLINAQDKLVALAVEREIPHITRAVEYIVRPSGAADGSSTSGPAQAADSGSSTLRNVPRHSEQIRVRLWG